MLKKAGIVVAATAAGLLALSPLAFAHDDDSDNEQHGLLNLNGTAVQVPIQACNNSVVEGVVGILAKDLENEDEHNGDCDQDNSAEN
ncbi:hypothetical protein GCM10023321_60090 [Pseudonocardia eucalypti]|uniref:Small secreted domain DUF320 n=1 Tax=Pseudonocardia eucalypti TaxID=648755 RepID=A0ABP9QTZ1_9PSEU|nr:hypothetical protein [Pseudonocardia eucalypti]